MGSTSSTCLKDDCPDEAELRTLLKGGVADEARLDWLENRMSDCRGCQERLEEFSARSFENVESVIDSEPASPVSEALRMVISRAKAGDFSGVSVSDSDGADLDFLEAAAADDDESVLGRLGKYRVFEVIAEGGMGLVLRADDPDLHREVAIKVLSPRLAEKREAREMFLREARAAAGVEHENVLPIYLVENSGELPWFVMPLVRGGTIEDRIVSAGESGLEFDEVLELALKVSRGLAAAHAKGLVHRDIKPANVMLDREGENVWLADFGLAAAVEASGTIAGTPGFMAPEVVAGKTADQRSDLFSLGCVFFAMVTGRQAFSGDTVEQLLNSVETEKPASVSERNGNVPRWFGELIVRMLAKVPEERLGSSAELVEILESHIEGRRTAVWRALLWRRVRRGLSVAALVGVVFAGGLWLLSATGRTQGVNRSLASMTGEGFSVKGRFGVHRSLGEAVSIASDGAVVEIFGNETWKTQPLRIEGKELTIRAARGNLPVLSSISEASTMIWSDSNLELEGLILEQRLRPKKAIPSLVSAVGAELRIRNCRLLSPARPVGSGIGLLIGVEDSPMLELTDVEMQGPHSYGIGIKNQRIRENHGVRLTRVVYLGPLLLLLLDERTVEDIRNLSSLDVDFALKECSVMSGNLIHFSSRGAAYPMRFRVERNAFDCQVGLLTSLGTAAEEQARRLLQWEDRENCYAVSSGMFFGQGRGTLGNPMQRTRATSRSWDEVAEWLGLKTGGSKRVERIFTEETRARFQAEGILDLDELKFSKEFETLGGTYGADLRRVGPGGEFEGGE